MQFTTVTVFLAALVAGANAAPNPPAPACNFGQYECGPYGYNGIVQCGYGEHGLEKLKIGVCPLNTHCGLIGVVPYCLAN